VNETCIVSVVSGGTEGEPGENGAACARAIRLGVCSYRSVKSILENGLDQQAEEPQLPLNSPSHSNVRGQDYYA